jgi:hypothetical protein
LTGAHSYQQSFCDVFGHIIATHTGIIDQPDVRKTMRPLLLQYPLGHWGAALMHQQVPVRPPVLVFLRHQEVAEPSTTRFPNPLQPLREHGRRRPADTLEAVQGRESVKVNALTLRPVSRQRQHSHSLGIIDEQGDKPRPARPGALRCSSCAPKSPFLPAA